MATYNTQSIKVPIETQLQVKNTIEGIKRLRAELEKQFEKVDPASSLGKSLAKLRTKIDQSFANIEASNLGSELFDEGDFKKVLGYVNQINQQLQQMRVQGTTATAKALGIDTQEIEEATKKLHELKEEYKQFKNRSVEKDNPAELARFEQHKKATGFNAKQSYQRNIDRLTTAEERAKNDFEALNTEESKAARAAAESKFKEAERLANEAKTEYRNATDALKNAKAEQSKQEQAKIDYNVAQSLKKVNAHTSPGRGKTQIISEYKDKIQSLIATKGGNFQKDGKKYAQSIAKWLDMSEGEIETLLSNRADVIVAQLNEKLNTAMTKNMRPFISKVDAAYAAGYNGEELTKANAAVTEAQNKEAAARVNLDAKEAALTTAEGEYNKATETFSKAEALLKEIQEQITLLKSLQQQLEEAADAEYEPRIEDAKKAVETAQQESTRETREQQTSISYEAAEETKKVNQVYQETRQGNQDAKNAEAEAERTRRELEAQIAAENRKQQQEAEQFKQNLQHTINQWMSAQQVINLVKDGIRQAYQDIQGLDAAMTNIAVVTDMNVSDLWGKINEYMSIAQQYGVTTQGVYEVSQLYYQQGLSTNEVMAATTETLKMARIAGMGYAEAADAMTVAIRAFKMEMGDAGHVTDVYSKVAAVTASDTEELAIAMSKTASSAESVGSSFENTTAMLAVMVETTRESAQNLGSALKSIISRYGEMKQGLTQDSDGEIIDYNKTDAALRSIGISIKDAQGQFRDFDDVIFELSEKWDSLDKNTQRYIATIMAGNRQQSRFIALVDNWERLDEVANAAQDSEDAGLLQYAKTLDSLDTKINTLKTSFQQFYMSIFDGEFFKGFIDIVINVVDNLSKMGPLLGGINLLQLINQIKLVGQLLLNTFSKGITKIQGSSKEWQKAFTNGWPTVGERIGDDIAKAIIAKAVPTGKEFAKGVEKGAQQESNNQNNNSDDNNNNDNNSPSESENESNQKLGIVDKTHEFLSNMKLGGTLKHASARDIESPLYKASDDEYVVANAESMVAQYEKAADEILNATTKQSEASIQWANKIKEGCVNFRNAAKDAGMETKRAAADAANKELRAADEEARIELNSAKEAMKQQAKQIGGQVAMAAGTLLSTYGMTIDQSTMAGYDKSTFMQAGGSILSVVGQAATGNYIGAAISAVTGIITAIERITNRAKYELENAKKAAEEANVERAQKKDKWQSLETYAKKLKEAEKARYDSNEAEQEWLNLNNEIAEKYPELISYIDAEGNSIVNLTEDYEGLSRAKREYLEQEAEYWDKKVEEARLERDILSDTYITDFRTTGGGMEGVDLATTSVVGWAQNNHQLQSSISQQLAFYDKKQGNITDADYLGSFFSEEGFYGKNLEELITILGLTDDEVNKVFGRKGFRFGNWTVQQAKDNGFSKVTSQEDLAKFYKAAVEEGLITGERQTALLRNSGVSTYHSDYLQAASDLALGRNFTSLGEINQWLAQFSGTQGLDNLLAGGVDLSYLFTLANNKDNVLGSSLAQQILSSTGLGTQNEDGYWIVDEDSQEKWDELVKYQQNEELYNSYLRSSISSHGNLLLHDTETADMLSGMSGYEQILLQRAETYAVNGKTLLDVRDSAETMQEIYGKYATQIGEWFMNLPPAVREEFNHFMANQKDYTLEELQTFLKTKLNLEEGDPLYQDLVSNWWTATNTAKYRAAKVIWKPTDTDITDAGKLTEEKFKELRKKNAPALSKYSGSDEEAYKKYLEDTEADDLRMLSFDNWKTNADLLEWAKKEVQAGDSSRYVTDEEAYNYYVDSVLAKWKEYGLITGEEVALLKERSAAELEQLSTFMSIREDMHSKAAFHRKGKISEQTEELRNTWNKLLNGDNTDIFDIDTSKLSAEAKEELASLLVAENVGTIEWLESVGEYAAKYGLNVENVKKAAAEYVQSSFSTEVALLVDATDDFKATLEDFAKKQESGYTFEEAKQLLNQLKSTGKKYDFTDIFEVNEQGLLVLKNFDQTYEDLYNSTLDRYTQFSDALGFLPEIPEGVEGKELEDLLQSTLGTLVAYSTDVAEYLETLSTEDVTSQAYKDAQAGLTQAYDDIKEFLRTNLGIEDEVLIDSIIKDLEAHQYTTATEIYNYLQSKAEELKISSDMLEAAFIQSLSQHSFIEATKKYTNALTAKDATSASTVGDLDSILKERAKITTLTVDGKKQDYSTWGLTQEGWDQYYAAELAALEIHGASLDAFGNLVVKDWNAWGEYIASSYGYSEKAIEAIDDETKKAAAQETRNQILAEARASQIQTMESFNNSMEEGFTSILQNWIETGEVNFDDVKNIIDELQARGALSAAEYNNILDAYNNLTKGIGGSVEEFIRIISEAAADSGITYDVSAIQAAVEDAYASLIETLANALKNGIEGTLSATDFEALAKRYGLGEEDYINTATGRQLTRSGEAKTIAGMYDAAEASGSTYGLGAEVWDTLKESGSQFQTYEAIEEAIAAIRTDAKAWAEAMGVTEEQAKNCLKVFEQIAGAARLDPDNPLFNFMEKDPTEGYGAGIDEILSNIDKARDGLQTLKEKGSIASKDFVNMFDFMYSQTGTNFEDDTAWLNHLGVSNEAIAKLEQSTGRTINTYRDFVNAMVQYSGKLGEVDGKALLELGINIDMMAGGMSDGLKKVAEEQIKFLQGIRTFLVAMKEMSDLEDIKINIGFEFTNSKGERTEELSLDDLINWNSIVSTNGWDKDSHAMSTATAAVKARLNNIVENLDKALEDTDYEGMWNNIFTHFFGEDGFTGSIEDGNALSILMGFVRNFGTLTPDEQRAALAQLAGQIFGPDGEFVENWQDIVYNYFKDFDKSKLRIQLKDSVVAELANLNIKVLNNEFILGEDQNWDDKLRTQVDAILAKQYGEDGFQYVVEGKKVTIVLIPEEVKTIINSPTVDETQWQWQESGENSGVYKRDIQVEGQTYTIHLSPSGEAVIVDTKGLPQDLSDDVTKQVFTAAGFVQDENGVYVKPEGETTKFQLNIAPTTSGVEEEAKTITDIYNLLTGASDDAIAFKITINPEASGIAEILTKIKEAYEVLSQVSPVNFTVNGGLNIPKNNQNNPNFPLKPTYINVSLLPESEEELSSVIADLTTIDEPHTANIGLEISSSDKQILSSTAELLDIIDTRNYSATVKAVENTSSFNAVKTALDNLTKPREVTITVKEEKENPATASGTAGVIGGGSGLVNAIAFSTDAKGNVALAGGNVSNLLAGAAFARGTLMGELGPELYVQGGQYHIAGANGPEFVDLHNDAIVFNHLQTAKLLNKGHINSHGSPVTDERTAVALAAGNVSGPAHANSNIDDAIAAVDAAIAMWQNIANASINDMLNASKGGGGGGSDTIKAVTVELQEWYNLTRKIAEVEERINKLLAERENIERRDGAAYLRNLREEQQYWREQLTYQTVLAQYQSAQLDRQREAIEQSEIWGQFFKFDSQGNIQFRNGNERNDGKGTLEFLQDLKSMGLEDQIKAIEKLGYSYTDADGNKLEGKDLVEQFLKDIDDQMKNYESLYDTVKQAETKIEQIKTNIEEVERQIKENQMDLEQDIYDTIVEAQEKVIDGLEEQKDLIEEANKAYVDGLNNALKAEKDLYSKNESISDREQLQRQLFLLRRSGGSASEIAALEEQLNDMLKNEYFTNQEDMIKDIEEANKEQIRKLEEQIRLQEEALEYQKEHGLIWSQVADIMSHDSDYILDFLQGNSPDFFAQSMLQQEQMLTEWAHKIGIFTEDRLMQNFMDEEADMWEGDKPQIFNSMDGELGTGDKKTSYGDFFNSLSDDDKEVVKQSYLQAYASARKEGKTEEEARKIAQEAIKTILGSYYDASLAPDNDPPSAQPDPGSGGGENPPTTVTPRKVYLYYDYEAVDGTQVKNQRVNITTGSTNKEEVYQSLRNWANIRSSEREGDDKKRKPGVGVKTSMSRMRGFSEGGLVDYTGPAMVHGTPSKPEAFLNAQQTAMISEAVKASGDGGALDGIKATLAALNSTIKGIVNNSTNTTSSFTVAPGAVTIQVAELSDSYDVEELSKDVMNRIVAIASKSTNRGVNRR